MMNTSQEVVKIRSEEKIQAYTGFEPVTFAISLHSTMCREFKLFILLANVFSSEKA